MKIRYLVDCCALAASSTWAAILVAACLFCAHLEALAADGHWVGTWGCGPQLVEPANLPPAPGLSNNTLRQVVQGSIGGTQLRVRFSNAYGTSPVTMNSVHVAMSTGGSAINTATDTALSFRGVPSVTVPPGEVAVSDPVAFALAPLGKVAVSIHFGATSPAVTGHPGSRTTSYLQAGNVVSAPSMPAASTAVRWYILTGIDVLADNSSGSVVTLGDSITDGAGSTTDANNRWPDYLARRLFLNEPTVAVVNQGIGGNAVVSGGLGPPALLRFDRDVLGQSGVRWLIILEGVNDIGLSSSQAVVTNVIAGYEEFVGKAHAHNIPVYGGTITPFAGSIYDTPGHRTSRDAVNDWIRTNGVFDAVIDFDEAVRDPADPQRLLPLYNSGDNLHLNPRGYQKMGNSVDLLLLEP